MNMTPSQAEAARRNVILVFVFCHFISEDHEEHMKDFLTMYNTFTESCFNSCARNFNYRILTPEEKQCAERCTDKLVNINHRLISIYMEINPMNRQLASTPDMAAQGDQSKPSGNEPQAVESQAQPVGNLARQVHEVFGPGEEVATEKAGNVLEGETRTESQNG